MQCSYANHKQTAIANVVDTYGDYVEDARQRYPGDGKWFKFGSVFTLGNIAVSAATGQFYDAFQGAVSAGGGYVAGAAGKAIAGAFFPFAPIAAGGAVTVMSVAVPIAVGLIVGTAVSIAIDNYMDSFQQCDHDPARPYKPQPGEAPQAGYKKQYYDPIILDLNGNGIETVDDMARFGAMFDHNGDGIATATGWAGKEDGLLVRDVNGDGKIDSGAELFGDSTLLQNGEKAIGGMEALADLDDNGDGIIDKNDKAYAELKVWQDKNGDGISTEDELMTLEELGITQIDLNQKEAVNQEVEGGVIKEQAKFVKADGSVGTLADVNFEGNNIHTRHLNPVELSDRVKALPDVYGSGRLNTLSQSAMKSDELADVLEQYNQATTRDEQKALLDKLMFAWAKTDILYADTDIKIMQKENIQWTEATDPNTATHTVRLRPNEQLPGYITETKAPEIADDVLEAKVKFMDAMMGVEPTSHLYEINRSQTKVFEEGYSGVKDRLYYNLLNQTLLKPYLEAIEVYTNGEEMVMLFENFEKLLLDKYASKPMEALEDLKDLIKINGAMLEVGGYEKAFVLLQEWRNTLSQDLNQKSVIDEMFKDFDGFDFKNTELLTGNNTINIKDDSQNNFATGDGNDIAMIAGDGDKTVDGGAGDDTLVSGKGEDFLIGGTGRNAYVFHKDSGRDFVSYDNEGESYDKLAFVGINADDAKFFKQGSNLVISFGNDSQVILLGGLDSISTKEVKFRFDDKVVSLEEIASQNLETLSASAIGKYVNGWRGNDELVGNDLDNQIYSFAGNDILTGGRGNDVLNGGLGDDTYHFAKGDGNDVVMDEDFATGKNTLVFSDVHTKDIQKVVFNGKDLVISHSEGDVITLKGYADNLKNSALTLKFADGTVWNSDNLLTKVTFEGSEGSDTIQGVLENQTNTINAYGGNDTVHGNQTASNTIDGGEGNDTLHGGDNVDTIRGGAGTDTLTGNMGNDILHGNDGDDTVNGGRGKDTLLGGMGGDFLNGDEDDDHLNGELGDDTLQGGTGNDTLIGGDGNNWLQGDEGRDTLVGGRNDDVYVADHLDTIVEDIRGLAGGYDTIHIDKDFDLSRNNLEAVTLLGTGNFRAYGDEFNNTLIGNTGDNFLDGRFGSDTLQGGTGNDVLDGGFGNDKLEGGIGSDTYIFGRNFGKDEIVNFNPNIQDKDIIKFTQGINLNHLNITRQDNHLMINQKKTTNTIKVTDFFDKDALGDWSLQEIVGTNGKAINTEQIKHLVTQGTNGNDTLYAYSKGTKLDGGVGHDILIGNIGKDTLIGGVGNDVLLGHQGNDLLEGGYGNDTYTYKKGDGFDTIKDIGGGKDALKLEGLTLSDLGFERKGNDLTILVKGTEDGVNIQGYFNQPMMHPFPPHHPVGHGKASRVEDIHVGNQVLDYRDVYKLMMDNNQAVI